jgi:hypothetical protein
MKRRAVLPIVLMVAVLSVGVATGSAFSTPSSTDQALLVRAGSSDKALDLLIERAKARGLQIKESGITKRDNDGEPVYQVVLDCTEAESALEAMLIWHEASIMKAEGRRIPLVEVLVFDAGGTLVFGCAADPRELGDLSNGKATLSLAAAKDKLDSRVNAAMNGMADGALRGQATVTSGITENNRGERVATVSVSLPAGATNAEIDSLISGAKDSVHKLNSVDGAGVTFSRLVVTRGGEKLFEEMDDYLSPAEASWHAPGYTPHDEYAPKGVD